MSKKEKLEAIISFIASSYTRLVFLLFIIVSMLVLFNDVEALYALTINAFAGFLVSVSARMALEEKKSSEQISDKKKSSE